jgi:tripartite-type tricarboxylate transporter receptor subunit TctC
MFAPPATPADRVKVLRESYAKALKDPELIAEAKKRGWIWNRFPAKSSKP